MLKLCFILLTLTSGEPIQFNVNNIKQVYVGQHVLSKGTIVNSFYIKESLPVVMQKINECK